MLLTILNSRGINIIILTSLILNKLQMKNRLLLMLFLFSIKVPAQNLVLNPGLDSYIVCPGFGQFSSAYINSWDKPSIGSSDYYNFNCPGIQPTVQSPRSGEGYAGIICYNFGTEFREYITGTFSSPLVAGTLYDVEFYVSLHDNYIQAVEEVGAYISTSAPGPFSNALHINVVPQIENIFGALNDTASWKQVSGQYLATGGEMFITIGNFHDDSTTTITQPGTFGSFGAYYFIDDVSVIADSSTAVQELTTIPEIKINLDSENMLQVQIPSALNWEYPIMVKCYTTSGKLVLSKEMKNENFTFDLNNSAGGILFVTLEDANKKMFSKKILLTGRQ